MTQWPVRMSISSMTTAGDDTGSGMMWPGVQEQLRKKAFIECVCVCVDGGYESVRHADEICEATD